MNIDEIRELIQLLSETGIAELEVQRGDNRVRIRKSFAVETDAVVSAPGQAPATVVAPPATAPKAEASASAKSQPEPIYAKSPIVGTFYEAASPDTPPFVRIGEEVRPGTVLCIIESMKLMNEIEAEVTGIIESKLVQNGQPVEYGEALFGIRPL
ncbi:MAG TPA: acetyl-CoA carboxylase biotin carboxyl carrier protein [Bryobacteraceae bacterium]|jgi:acetyl-CoA carboxylase biotin carboxyl carrier protein|nr:acetyl-CoA carboxylase biotin carboxyl carrier protein [Bryobacteraceae bacterium]